MTYIHTCKTKALPFFSRITRNLNLKREHHIDLKYNFIKMLCFQIKNINFFIIYIPLSLSLYSQNSMLIFQEKKKFNYKSLLTSFIEF